MANGTPALLTLDPPSAPSPAPDKPEAAILRRVGEVTADLTVQLSLALLDWSNSGSMTADNREKAGALFVQLYRIQESMPADDFSKLMRERGKEVLWQRYDEGLRQQLGAGFNKAALDRDFAELIGHLYSVLAQVTRTEEIYRKAWAD